MIKKAAIYDPYLDTLGGGERYCLTVAETLLENGYSVDLFWSGDPDLLTKASDRFSLNLKKINIVPDIFKVRPSHIDEVLDQPHAYVKSAITPKNPLEKIKTFISKIQQTSQYDIIFFLSDGSIPVLLGQKNFLHVQVPFAAPVHKSNLLLDQLKLLKINKIITNSSFTNKFTQKYYGKNGTVLYPPVDTSAFHPTTKDKIILSVGRFDNILNAKRQDVLIQSYSQINHHHPDWKLILAGGSLTDPENNNYLHYLKTLAKDLPVEFIVNPKFDQLQSIYSTASIYWHAAGFDVDENIHPENTEHFGITIVESMAAGLVPVVINKGGIPEIITNSQNGFLWDDTKELIAKTQLLISSNSLLSEMSQKAITDSTKFSKEKFKSNLLTLIQT